MLFQYCNISLHKQARYDIADSKLRISIYRDTGSKVDYFTCIFNKLVASAFFINRTRYASYVQIMLIIDSILHSSSAFVGQRVVSEPDPRKRRVWYIGWGGSVHCGMLGILWIAELCKACRVFCWTRHTYKRSIFPAWCSQHYKTKQNVRTVLVRLAFPINAHQNANQKPIGSAPSYRAQCTLPPQPMCQTLLFDFSRVWFRD